jgi:Nucleotidyl transferase AbiEii toxin, Type IV TA system
LRQASPTQKISSGHYVILEIEMSHNPSIGERNRERVKAQAWNKGQDPAQRLQQFIQERLCVRLWAFEEGARLTLKGGAVYHFAPEFLDWNRPTSDIDVHSYEILAHDEVMSLFQKAISIEDDDGVEFTINKTSVLEHEHGEHNGLRVHITGTVGKCSVNTYADVGIGGEAPINVREIAVNPMIAGQTSATIRTQPFAYSMAEKLHAIVVRGVSNSRMKDYRDLLVLSRKGFDDADVRQAIVHTFSMRHTDLPESTPDGLLPIFSEVKQVDWERYLHRNRVTGMPQDLAEVVEELRQYFDDKLNTEYAPAYLRYA